MWVTGCLNAPPPDLQYDKADTTALEVYRVFCRRVAKSSYPDEQVGLRFYQQCDNGDPEDEDKKELRMMLRYRDEILSSFKRTFGEESADGVASFADGELSGFLKALVPLYDPPQETIPTTTRGIAALLEQLIDENDERANNVINTVARLVQRNGYRPAEFNIGAIRAILTYPGLETLSTALLPVLSTTTDKNGDKVPGAARDQFIAVLNALALELADDPVKLANPEDSTLRRVIELALTEDETQSSNKLDPTPVLLRDNGGEARGDRSAGTPFAVAGRDDDAASRNAQGVAMSGGEPAYETIDATKTMFAALMRETSALISRTTPQGDELPRAPVEAFAHGLRNQLGPWGSRTERIGQNDFTFQGPDTSKSPLLALAHAGAAMLKYPETLTLIRALDVLLDEYESEATGVDFSALRIAEASKRPEFESAKLNGPHEFWDDLTRAAMEMGTRPGLFEGLVRSFVDPASGEQGRLFAAWMRYKDHISYPNAPSTDFANINKPVAQGYEELVSRGQPDVGWNRSIWQRTMSLIHSLNDLQVCNKKGAILKAETGGPLGTLTFPAGDLAGTGYDACALIEIQNTVEAYSLAVLERGSVNIKDDFASVLAAIGAPLGISGSVDEIQEKSSKLDGFDSTPTARSLARFIFAPRSEFITDLFTPQLTVDGVEVVAYEPDGLFPLEAPDEKTPLANKPASFMEIGKPLLDAFDKAELREPTDPVTGKLGKLKAGYMFGHLLDVLHRHWSSKKNGPCPEVPSAEEPGCTQSLDPAGKFYSPQTGLVSYEELLAESFDEHDFVNILHKASVKLAEVKVPNGAGETVDGVKALGDFVQRLVTVDPALKKWTGEANTKSNLCEDDGMGGCRNGVGFQVPQLAPIHLVADALHAMDVAHAEDPQRHEAWLEGRSRIVDQLLETIRSGSPGSYTYQLRDRTAYAIVHPALQWFIKRIEEHRDQKNDLEQWATGDNGLAKRLDKVLRHPITAGVVDLLDAFWDQDDASNEFTKVVAYMTDENNEASYRSFLTAIADTVLLLDRDDQLSPAIQFAALVLAPNVFQAIDGAAAPNAADSTAYAALELTGGVVTTLNDPKQNPFKKSDEPTALTKLLNNAVLATSNERSALEVLIDAAADVNRMNEEAGTLDPLTAEEDRKVFGDVKLFLKDDKSDQRSMERLYEVIQNRKVKR